MMKTIEVKNTDARENLTTIRACLIKAVNDGERVVTVFSSLFFARENLDRIKQELVSKLGGMGRVRSSSAKVFCGYRMHGLAVQFLSDDKDLLKSRILDLFNGQFPSSIEVFEKQGS